jgi:predicted acyltransferase
VLFSGGLCFWLTAAFYWVMETKNHRKWAFPLLVIGMNSIAAYLIAHLFDAFLYSSLKIHLGEHFFAFLGTGLEPLLNGAAVLALFWLMLLWMYNRKLFLRI